MAVDYEEGRRLLANFREGRNREGFMLFMLHYAEALLNPVSAAPSPVDEDEVERVAKAICEAMMETGRTDWGGPVPAPDYYAAARAAIAAMRQRAAMDRLLRISPLVPTHQRKSNQP